MTDSLVIVTADGNGGGEVVGGGEAAGFGGTKSAIGGVGSVTLRLSGDEWEGPSIAESIVGIK